MKSSNTILTAFFIFSNILTFGQTKAETISYLNGILELHQTKNLVHSFSQLDETYLIVNKTVYISGWNPKTLKYKFNPIDALFISSTNDEKGQTRFSLSFRQNSLKFIYSDYGETKEEMTNLQMEALTTMTKIEIEKFIKAYKHLIKLYGGTIKNELF